MDRILVAEDDPILLHRIARAFEEYQNRVQVLMASNGQQAVDHLDEKSVALLITDIQMPEIDGLELLAHVSKNHPVVRCFVMTAHDSKELQQQLPKDLLRFFRKPLDPHALVKAAMEALDRDIVRGMVSGISVPSFLFMVSLEKKSCLLEVVGEGEKRGLLYFEEGEPFDASFEGIHGEGAIIEILNLPSATYHFRNFPDTIVPRRVDTDLGVLIDEARRRQEELETIDWDDMMPE